MISSRSSSVKARHDRNKQREHFQIGRRHRGRLRAFLALCFAVAATGGIANSYGLTGWYPTLVKPSFNPPNWLFGPVWTVLYIMIAVSGARLVLSRAEEKEPALALYGAQLALNAAWSWVFFYGQALGAAAIVIVAMWLAILGTIIFAWGKDRVASMLLIPILPG